MWQTPVTSCAEQPPVLIGAISSKKKYKVAYAESENTCSNQKRGPTFHVLGKALILYFARLYILLQQQANM